MGSLEWTMCGPFQSPGAWFCQGFRNNAPRGQGLISVNDERRMEEDSGSFLDSGPPYVKAT